MASLGTLRPDNVNSYHPTGFSPFSLTGFGGGGLADDSDTTFVGVDTNSTGSYAYAVSFANMPGDFASMDTLSVQIRRAWSSTPTNTTWDVLSARIMTDDGGTVLAAADSGGTFKTVSSNITDTTPTNSSVVAFDYVNTSATQGDWDNAEIELRVDRTRSKGGGSETQRVHEVWITGTYTASVGGATVVDPIGMRGFFGI